MKSNISKCVNNIQENQCLPLRESFCTIYINLFLWTWLYDIKYYIMVLRFNCIKINVRRENKTRSEEINVKNSISRTLSYGNVWQHTISLGITAISLYIYIFISLSSTHHDGLSQCI